MGRREENDRRNWSKTRRRINELNSEYRHEEFEKALREVRKKSSPGKDRIDYEMIENMSNNVKKKMLVILNDF